ncbi:hypothetical protein [Falsarthrobacter nasiphocae]|uniref:DivIVA domain-containing protein n=1 Tax=Falsarthrobacter nasiphocae TaxID=189863 RepID=A0AAE3YI84_9MICC|nr:hypothetical protein [Falsarthrobacter nasiphocae]MDR6892639.1 DivIVA domain-containing protein [Falsarthrobacter nasiphocae]
MTFSRVSSQRTGYEPQDVKRYVAGHAGPTFRSVKGGFNPVEVDEFVDLREDRRAVAAARGDEREGRLTGETGRLAVEVLARALRPAGRRFRAPSRARGAAYAPRGVDELCERLVEALGWPGGSLPDDGAPGGGPFASDHRAPRGWPEPHAVLTSTGVRTSVFEAAPSSNGAIRGYEEAQVDAFLEDAARLLAVFEGLRLDPRVAIDADAVRRQLGGATPDAPVAADAPDAPVAASPGVVEARRGIESLAAGPHAAAPASPQDAAREAPSAPEPTVAEPATTRVPVISPDVRADIRRPSRQGASDRPRRAAEPGGESD